MKRTISLALSIAALACSVFVSGATCSHIYEKTEIEATCRERAHTLSVCSNCGDTLKEYASVVEYPENEAYFSIEGEREEDTLNVKVIMGNNPGVWATGLNLYYNSEALQLIDKANGEIWSTGVMLNDYEATATTPAYLRYYSDNSTITDNTKNGVVFTASFKILDNADKWNVVFETKYKHVINAVGAVVSFKNINSVALGYSDHHFDEGEVTLAPTYTSDGELLYSCLDCEETKTEQIPRLVLAGDANIDGKLDARDCFMIKSHLVGALGDSVLVGDLDANEDGEVNAKDLLYLAKMFAEKE